MIATSVLIDSGQSFRCAALRGVFDRAGDEGAGLRDDGEIARHQHAEAIRADRAQAGGACGLLCFRQRPRT
jgi:hypothetical protein